VYLAGEHGGERGRVGGPRVRRGAGVLLRLLPQQLQVLRADELPHGRYGEIAVELADELDGRPGQLLVAGAAGGQTEGVGQPGVLIRAGRQVVFHDRWHAGRAAVAVRVPVQAADRLGQAVRAGDVGDADPDPGGAADPGA